MTSTHTPTRRQLKGVVVSHAPEKTIVVRVDRTVLHPKYGKRLTRGERYQVHDEMNAYKTGDLVLFEECRPYSKNKRWRVISRIEKI